MKYPKILPAMLRSAMQAGLLLIALFGAVAVGLPTLRGATITVTNSNDNGPGSLRQALADAVNGDTINFDSSLNGQAITLTSSQLLVNKSITIAGPGGNQLWLRRSDTLGTPEFRIFHISSGNTVTISGLNMTGGKVTSDAGAGIFSRNATLIINDSAVDNNSASSGGAGVYNSGASSGNATLTINNSTVNNNWCISGLGGGICNDGISGNARLTVTNSHLAATGQPPAAVSTMMAAISALPRLASETRYCTSGLQAEVRI